MDIKLIKVLKFNNKNLMDLFDFPDDFKLEMTPQQLQQNEHYLLNHPLFMKQLPQNLAANSHIAALLQLKQDDDPDMIAQDLNKQANKRLSQNPNGIYHMKQAYHKYTDAINIKCPSSAINAKLHANRAQLNIKLKNYGKVINDCKICLQYDVNYVKGYYRYAKALLFLGRFQDCVKLLSERKEEELVQLRVQAEGKLSIKLKQIQNKNNKKEQKENMIKQFCVKKGWKYQKRDQPLPEGVKAQIIDNNLSIPLLILYPQCNQFDLIAQTFEQNKIKQHVKQPIEAGLPWDHKKQYNMNSIQLFCQISQAVLMKVPKQAKIGDILSRIPFKEAIQIQVVRKDNEFYPNYINQYKII